VIARREEWDNGRPVFLAFFGPRTIRGTRGAERDRLRRVEHKLDLILTHLGIAYLPPKEGWQVLAEDPARKIAAIKEYREQYGVGMAEAKKAVEDYIEGQSKSS
jgi:hypothetical protein